MQPNWRESEAKRTLDSMLQSWSRRKTHGKGAFDTSIFRRIKPSQSDIKWASRITKWIILVINRNKREIKNLDPFKSEGVAGKFKSVWIKTYWTFEATNLSRSKYNVGNWNWCWFSSRSQHLCVHDLEAEINWPRRRLLECFHIILWNNDEFNSSKAETSH